MDVIKHNIHWPFRLYLAYVFIPIGYGKLGVMVAGMDLVGYLVGPFQLLGSLFVLIGAFVSDSLTRVGAAMIAIIMIGAIYMHLVKWGDAVDTIYFPLFLLIISLVFLIRGKKIFE